MSATTRLLQVSDVHFGTERDGAVDALLALHAALAPDVVVLSGDLTQRATARQFEAARAFADAMALAGPTGGSTVLALAGNHDVPLWAFWTRLLAPYRRYRRRFGSEQGFVHEDDALVLVGLNSTRHLRHKDGEVSENQVEAVAATFEALPADGRVRAVVMHHPVHGVRPQDEANLVHGGEAAVRRWSAAGVDLVLGGHVHLPYAAPLSVRYDRLATPVWCVQAGTALSRRTRGGVPNSVNLVAAGPARTCRLERWDFEAGAREFTLHSAETLELDERVPALATAGVPDPLQAEVDVLAPAPLEKP